MAIILIIEDEVDLNNLIRSHLELDGHVVFQAFDGPAGLALTEAERPDLIILDWMLPGLDGLAACRELRRHYLTPIVMLTARSEEIDRVLGLEVGADDYVVKPFSIRELLARVRSILRRVALDTGALASAAGTREATRDETPGMPPDGATPIIRGALWIDPRARQVTLDGQPVELTRREFDLLALLAAHPGRAFARDYLLDELWGPDYAGVDRTVDSHVAQLRRKLGPHGEKITTVWGVGYRFVE